MLDYIVRYKVITGDKIEYRENIVSVEFEEYDCDFLEDILKDRLEENWFYDDYDEIIITHMETLIDRNVDVYKL